MKHVLAAIGGLCLAVTLVAAGFFVCSAPATTRILSSQVSAFNLSPYEPSELVELACATRDFTVDPYTEGKDAAHEKLADIVMQAADTSAGTESPKANLWAGVLEAIQGTANTQAASTNADRMQALALQGEQYALDADAIQHLADVNNVIRMAMPLVIVCMLFALVSILALVFMKDRALLGRMLVIAPAALLVVFLVLGLWAALDFNGFFTAFHNVFFPQGNWTFPYDSLLICMYPQAFWVAMGALWLAVTVLAAIICIVVGIRLQHANSASARK